MISKGTENLIVKYLSNSANASDLDMLNNWIEEPENEDYFKEYIKTHFAITIAMNDTDLNEIREKLQREIRKDKNIFNRFQFTSLVKYAAIALLFMGVGYFYQQGRSEIVTVEKISPRADAITLQLDNGNVEVIEQDGNSNVIDAKGQVVGVQQGKKLVYKENFTDSKMVYNTLSVPNGKRFNVTLSDGTEVYLNSGSTLKYPVNFLREGVRQVFLKGEAFFEVSHIKENSFVVNAEGLDIKVYGTKFNVTNYPEDNSTQVVLVDGSVSLLESNKIVNNESEVFLKPGFMGIFNKIDSEISKEEVNTAIYTSWMDGNLVFRNISFEKIIQKLGRHYNVVIINNNEKLKSENFNATIETEHESIEQVFNYFNKVYQIEYRIIENKIIIE